MLSKPLRCHVEFCLMLSLLRKTILMVNRGVGRNQNRHLTKFAKCLFLYGVPNRIRTGVVGVKGLWGMFHVSKISSLGKVGCQYIALFGTLSAPCCNILQTVEFSFIVRLPNRDLILLIPRNIPVARIIARCFEE
jgi:hypothetical protein